MATDNVVPFPSPTSAIDRAIDEIIKGLKSGALTTLVVVAAGEGDQMTFRYDGEDVGVGALARLAFALQVMHHDLIAGVELGEHGGEGEN